MSDHDVRMIMLSTEDLDASIAFYESLGMTVKFRDGTHFAALDGGSAQPTPGQVVVGIKTADVAAAAAAVEAAGGAILRPPSDDAHERRAVVYDVSGNGLVFYSPLKG